MSEPNWTELIHSWSSPPLNFQWLGQIILLAWDQWISVRGQSLTKNMLSVLSNPLKLERKCKPGPERSKWPAEIYRKLQNRFPRQHRDLNKSLVIVNLIELQVFSFLTFALPVLNSHYKVVSYFHPSVFVVLYFMTNIKVKIMKKYTSPSGVELPLKGDILVRKSYSTSGNRDFLE